MFKGVSAGERSEDLPVAFLKVEASEGRPSSEGLRGVSCQAWHSDFIASGISGMDAFIHAVATLSLHFAQRYNLDF